ncbi:MAG: tryptophan--tRNA ligase [Candidatus Aminicenantes bacterium]|nr:tryptophan--tRNA ligase [Candidatus Aminicenantes bacterium]
MNQKKTVMSGVRPTGLPHLGNWAGAFKNWVELQKDYRCYYSIVDWHALTSEYQNTKNIKQDIGSVLLDMLAVGIDPEKSTVFLQSEIKEIAELFLLFGMFTPLGWLERVPTFKEQQKELKDKDINTIGFLGYPLLQTIDIIIVKANVVPVGEDQVYHLELAREIVRRFNNLYGQYFPEPIELLTPIPKLPGLDGRKMSKSYDNAIYLSDSAEAVEKKIRPMVTDTRRKRRTDPGVPDDCPVFDFHKSFSSEEEKKEIVAGCTSASIGCIDCKKILIKNMNNVLDPFRERRKKYENMNAADILEPGTRKVKAVAKQTLEEVRELMKI